MSTPAFLSDFSLEVRLTDGTIAKDAVETTAFWTQNRYNVTIKNISEQPLQIMEVALFAGQCGLSDDTTFYGEGYHMLSQYRGTVDHLETIGSYELDQEFFNFPITKYDKDLFSLHYLLELYDKEKYYLLAFASCHKFIGKFRYRRNYLEVVMDTENIYLLPGQAWTMEEFIFLTGTTREPLYDSLAYAINQNHPPMTYDTIPTGWCSYYSMGQMSPEGIYANAQAMAERIPNLGMIQIDAGTNSTDGDWFTPRFEDDLATIARKVREEGVTAGGYLSPFIINKESDLYKNHPEWLVRDEKGEPTNRRSRNKNWYVLDGSHPEAREYLRRIIRYMYDDCEFRYFKLDFLSYGPLPAGQRYDSTVTSVEAYRMGMKAIVEEAGADSFVLACNAPFWPTLGLCHGNRTTNDIARNWPHVRMNALEQFYRNWQHQTLWINDPDCIVLEKLDLMRSNGLRPSTLTDDEFEFHKAFAIACGGMILSGDLLYEISDTNLQALETMLEYRGEAAVFDSDAFEIGRFSEKPLVCLFNWADEAKEIHVPLDGAGTLYNLWTNEKVTTFDDFFFLTLPAHSGMVLKIQR